VLIAEVIGNVVSPVQHPALDSQILLLLRPLDPSGQKCGPTRIGIDRIGAGLGDRVLFVDEGNSGRQLLDAPGAPVKTIVLAIIDSISSGNQTCYRAGAATPQTP